MCDLLYFQLTAVHSLARQNLEPAVLHVVYTHMICYVMLNDELMVLMPVVIFQDKASLRECQPGKSSDA